MARQWNDKIFAKSMLPDELSLEVFRFQYQQNKLYRQYVDALRVDPTQVGSVRDIPFLPIRFFKSHAIQATEFDPEAVFESSGTTGMINSRHLVKDANLYQQSFLECFHQFYGPIEEWCILGLLPSYLERKNSSLVFMVNELIARSGHRDSGFYLNEFDKLQQTLANLESAGQKTLLIGVTFALLDFAAFYQDKQLPPLRNTVIMETGGMKGRRKEMIRQEVHDELALAFGIDTIHSEYGMTELLSQAYSKGNGIFECPRWMQIVLRDDEDPREIILPDQYKQAVSGAINVIDLANIYSCSFIATDDAGRLFPDGKFEALGRIDNSDLRGCSLLTL